MCVFFSTSLVFKVTMACCQYKWKYVAEARRLIGREESPWCCEGGRGWRLCGGDSAPDFGEYRTDRAATESRDLGRKGQRWWVVLLRLLVLKLLPCVCNMNMRTRVSTTYLFSAVQFSLCCLAMTDQEESFPQRSYNTHQLQSPAEDPRCWLLHFGLQHVEDCPAHTLFEHLPLHVHRKRLNTWLKWTRQNSQIMCCKVTINTKNILAYCLFQHSVKIGDKSESEKVGTQSRTVNHFKRFKTMSDSSAN